MSGMMGWGGEIVELGSKEEGEGRRGRMEGERGGREGGLGLRFESVGVGIGDIV